MEKHSGLNIGTQKVSDLDTVEGGRAWSHSFGSRIMLPPPPKISMFLSRKSKNLTLILVLEFYQTVR